MDGSHDLSLQRDLARLNHGRFAPALPTDDWRRSLADEAALHTCEIELLEGRRAAIAARAASAPKVATGFARWFAELAQVGPAQGGGLFAWLARAASIDQLRWYIGQEIGAAGELEPAEQIALVQIALPERVRAPLARVYCDAAGIGDAYAYSSTEPRFAPLARIARELGLDAPATDPCAEALAIANLVTAMVVNRRYAFHAIGALAAGALIASSHAELVDAGLARTSVPEYVREAYAERAMVCARHAETWVRDVITPLVAQRAEVATAIAEGGLVRLAAGATWFARVRRELHVPETGASGRSKSPTLGRAA